MRVSVIKKIIFFVLPLIMFSAILYYNCDTDPKPPGGNTNPTYSTVSIVQSSEADASDLEYNDILAMVTDAVELAGGFDELWLGSAPSASDFTDRYKLSWDANYLYVLAEITDNVLSDTHVDPVDNYYNDDCLELFIDEDKSGGDHTHTYNAFAYHMAIDCTNKVDLHTDQAPHTYNSHINVTMATAGTTYTWEASVKIYDDTFIYGDDVTGRVSLAGNKEMGFSIAYCDNDGGSEREHFIGSVYIEGEDKNVSWQNADYFGSLLFVE